MRFGAVLGMLLAAGAASASNIQGELSGDTTWTPSGSPYVLTGDVIIPPGVTLTIVPGVVVIAERADATAGGADAYRVELIVRGTLRALGTPSSPVTFRATSQEAGLWRGIRVDAGTTTLSNVLLRDAFYGVDVSGPNSSATISSSTLTANSTGVAVYLLATLAMDHTVVQANSTGITIQRANASLLYDTLISNSDTGLIVTNDDSSYNVVLRDSIVTGNGSGISNYSSAGSGSVLLFHNDVWNNSHNDYYKILGEESISANPLFVSASNLRLTAYSPARHAAADGRSDLGALAFTGDPTPFLAGSIHEDTTLSGSLALAGDLTVPPGITVTIASGTTFTAAASDVMKAGADTSKVEFIARGTLRVLGTDTSPVTFKAATAGKGNWRGVRVEEGTQSTLSGALIRDATFGLEVSGYDTSATLSSSTLTANSLGALIDTTGSFTMDHTLVHSNGTGVSFVNGTGSFLYNTLSFNSDIGLVTTNNTSPYRVTVDNSLVTHNGYGLVRANGPGTVTLFKNDVWGNSRDFFNITEQGENLSADPLYISPSDFHLQAGSPCRNASRDGTDLGALPYTDATVARVEILPTAVTVGARQTTAFMARAFNAVGQPVRDVPFTWSATSSVGTIDAQGLFTASCRQGSFSAAVTATSPNGVSASATVTLVPGPAAQVSISPSATGVEADATVPFTASVKDSCGNPRSESVTWSTAASSGTITSSGQYTPPCLSGSYVGAVIATLGALSSQADVYVSAGPRAQLSLSPLNPRLIVGSQTAFSAVAIDNCGNSALSSVSWSLLDGGGSLSPSGVFTAGTTPGTGTLQVTSGALVARTPVTVTEGPAASLYLRTDSVTLTPQAWTTFYATPLDAYGNFVDAPLTWSLVNGGGTIYSNGAFNAGTVAGTYPNTVRVVAGAASATVTVIITPGPANRVLLSPAAATVAPRGSVHFTARVDDVFGNLRSDPITWSLAIEGLGTISASGDFTASSVLGTYANAIRARVDGATGYASVTIQPGALSRLTLTPASASLRVGASVAFSARGFDAEGNEVTLSPFWEVVGGGGRISSDGTFTAGTTAGTYPNTVRVSAQGLSASASVTVTPGPVSRVTVSPSRPSLPTNSSVSFTARAEDAFGNEQPGRARTWSANPAAGAISPEGVFTAGSTAGEFADAVTATVDGVKGSTAVLVLGPASPDGGSAPEPGDGGSGPKPGDGGSGPQSEDPPSTSPPASGGGCSAAAETSAPWVTWLLLGLSVTRRRRPSGA